MKELEIEGCVVLGNVNNEVITYCQMASFSAFPDDDLYVGVVKDVGSGCYVVASESMEKAIAFEDKAEATVFFKKISDVLEELSEGEPISNEEVYEIAIAAAKRL